MQSLRKLPEEYHRTPPEELVRRIEAKRAEMGKSLLILGHHYQSDAIIALSDRIGDSYKLCRDAAASGEAKWIVFCGVRFMAESADILAREDQIVLHPDPGAGCPLADMADLEDVETAWDEIVRSSPGAKTIPVTYVNSSAEIKAFTGRQGGTVCTSSNARRAMEWGFKRGDKLFFFPDQHLGRNTARTLGVKADEIVLWDQNRPLGGNCEEAIRNARVILWNGFCHVHTFFTPAMVRNARDHYPGCRVAVHPECPEEVTILADEAGSTSDLIRMVEQAAPGSTIVVGTEVNLVNRLARKYTDRTIIPLGPSVCPNMARVGLDDLAFTLEHPDKADRVTVPTVVKKDARKALENMLSI